MLKKFYTTALIYLIVALSSGVFYREFTKYNSFSGTTKLGLLHTHFFVLGMFFFLITLLLEKQFNFCKIKQSKQFYIFYNIGLVITGVMFLIRGVFEVVGFVPNNALNHSISGIAGIGHLCLTIGMGYFFYALKKSLPN